ncbi:MAG: hypothetical protein J6L72_04390 [Butyricicoccus sp.]|nr:hypothetical protein [Butyricicoccus sp.]
MWTLAQLSFSPPEYKSYFVDVPLSDIAIDLSTALTDGEPRYNPRTLSATLESSEGDRLAREARIDEMVNLLDGRRMNIVLPDDPSRYITGRVRVARQYNDMAHCAVAVTALCEPWRYAADGYSVDLSGSGISRSITLTNTGRRSVVPLITVSSGELQLSYGGSSRVMAVGRYRLPDLYLTTGEHTITVGGVCTATLDYREAVL